MSLSKLVKRLVKNEQGQHAVECMLLIAVMVVFIAAALHGILPNLSEGFQGMAAAIGGPTP